uniref:Retrotransposon protein, putative, Ty1-copia subclass n=2 Tax=Oryza sativa subsp. japonica TaxID=39947 RepID=Q53J94_ORYSJ|nr:retrotransposon protein, putative, Ty1-copia sub-class [Oryza sativa Japonica Group]ABA92973.1 retrotransposon protein, putative, Ty1-copia subclass [Oryza sativa Japonica Group]
MERYLWAPRCCRLWKGMTMPKIMTAPAPSNFNLRSILEKEKLTGTNFMDWYHNLRIVLRQEHKEFVLTQPFLADLPNNAPATQRREHERRCNEYLDISCLMLATMSLKLQRQYEALDAHTIITGLRNMFEDQARAERFNTSKSLFACRLAEGNPVSPHVIKMIGYTESLDKLGFPLSRELATDLILQSLPPSFEPFIMNFNMNNLNRTLAELHVTLKTAEESIKKNSNHVMGMHKRKPNNKKSGQKRKLNSDEITTTSNSKTKVQKTGPAKDAECFICKEIGHWKRNCKKYLEQLKQKQQDGKSSTSVYNINAKRQRPNDLNPTFIWHCRLGHINEKRMEKLHRDGLLHSFDFESFETCESCLLGKMTKAPFTGQNERASELLGLVHTHVCGSMSSTAKGGFGYFITFTDDLSRYGHRDILLLDNDEPTTYEETMVGPDSEKWLGAMKSEIESMHVNQIWNLVDPPDGVKAIECKWVFKKKTDVDGNVHIYKIRLVAKSYRQIQGVDYDETFSPVAMLKSIQIVLAIAVYFDYEIWKMDVKTAFLNANLDEDVYMTQPKGFVDPQLVKKICKLQKSIYGLKQAISELEYSF